MKCHFIIGAALVAVAVAVGRAQAEEPGPSTQPISIETDPGLDFTLKVPEGWHVVKQKTGPEDRVKLTLAPTAAPLPRDQVQPALRVAVWLPANGKPFKDASLGGFAERAAAEVSTAYTDGKLLAFDQLKLDGAPAYKVVVSGHTTASKAAQTNSQFLAVHNGKFYGVLYASDPSVHDKYLPDVAKILESFRWKGPPATQSATQSSTPGK